MVRYVGMDARKLEVQSHVAAPTGKQDASISNRVSRFFLAWLKTADRIA
jgi:hypothetical protein